MTHERWHMQTYVQEKRGFTLIELSIVLVIISLIVGGVIGGKSLIKSTTLVSAGNELQSFGVAFNSFGLQYDAKPGDMRDASDYWSSTTNGNGNGLITWHTAGGESPVHIDANESGIVWEHFVLAELLVEKKLNVGVMGQSRYRHAKKVKNALYLIVNGDLYGAPTGDGAYNAVNMGTLVTGAYPNRGALIPRDMLTIDKKFDDGSPVTGAIVATTAMTPEGATLDCHDGTDYEKAVTERSCRLIYWLDK